MPRWVPLALIVGAPLLAASPHAIEWLGTLPETAAALAIGWYVWRGHRTTASTEPPGNERR